MSNTFLAADWHLFHSNIIKYSNRPFKHVGEMNQTILDNLNSKVKENDWLYFLGDLALFKPKSIYLVHDFLSRIRCKNLCWIKGNHDKVTEPFKDRFFWIKDYCEISVNNQNIVLCHYPMMVWNKKHYGSWMLTGHSHYSLPATRKDSTDFGKILDVGVDGNNFMPYSFDEIAHIMKRKVNKQLLDHHFL